MKILKTEAGAGKTTFAKLNSYHSISDAFIRCFLEGKGMELIKELFQRNPDGTLIKQYEFSDDQLLITNVRTETIAVGDAGNLEIDKPSSFFDNFEENIVVNGANRTRTEVAEAHMRDAYYCCDGENLIPFSTYFRGCSLASESYTIVLKKGASIFYYFGGEIFVQLSELIRSVHTFDMLPYFVNGEGSRSFTNLCKLVKQWGEKVGADLLITNMDQCWIDSITVDAASSGGSALRGGVQSGFLAMLAKCNVTNSIGLYTPMLLDRDDPVARLNSTGYTSGELFVKRTDAGEIKERRISIYCTMRKFKDSDYITVDGNKKAVRACYFPLVVVPEDESKESIVVYNWRTGLKSSTNNGYVEFNGIECYNSKAEEITEDDFTNVLMDSVSLIRLDEAFTTEAIDDKTFITFSV